MVYLSLGFKLCASSYLLHDGIFGISGACCGSRNIATEPKGLGLERSPKVECKLILNEAKFRHSFRVDSSNFGWYKGEWNLMNRSVIQPSVRVESNGKPVTIWQEGRDAPLGESIKIPEPNYYSDLDYGNGGTDSSSGAGGNGKFPPNGGGDGGGDGDGDDNEENSKEEGEFGPLLRFEEVIKQAESRGASLPSDMLEAAKVDGIQKVFLDRYLDLQASAWPLGILMKSCALLRNRMLADPSFLFKVGTEMVIDSCCATFAEVKKRGKDFWAEFELYAADLLVGVVVSTVLVGLLAPYARIGQPSAPKGLLGRMAHVNGALPSSVFEAERPGCKFSIQQRIGTYFYKGFLYGSVGFVCGLVGQGIANLIMTAKRSVKKSEEGVPVPPLVKSAALWGAFLAISSNTRYQIINGLERVVEASPVTKCVPPLTMAFTVGVRFANNIYGGMQFVDWARWSGVQ